MGINMPSVDVSVEQSGTIHFENSHDFNKDTVKTIVKVWLTTSPKTDDIADSVELLQRVINDNDEYDLDFEEVHDLFENVSFISESKTELENYQKPIKETDKGE